MTVRSEPLTKAAPSAQRYTTLHAGSVIAHGLSYLTTLWFVQWIWPDGGLYGQSIVACLLELLLFAMKSALHQHELGIGWTGVGVDGLINAGGIIPRADAILTFPPIAVMLSIVHINVATLPPIATLPTGGTVTLPGLLAALLGGILLSAVPGRLWRAAEKRR